MNCMNIFLIIFINGYREGIRDNILEIKIIMYI